MGRTNNREPLSAQVKRKVNTPVKEKSHEYEGDFGTVISTGSTLLDLAISGGRVHGGGMPGGILIEAFGPSGSGKTVLLSECAGEVQRKGGEVMFADPEARLNTQFARIFDLDTSTIAYSTPNTVTEVFEGVREWDPKPKGKTKIINGIFTDSLAALSTEMEMEKKEGDKMGMRRAKEFSEELRKTCRILAERNHLMMCSNQVRVNVDAGAYGQKYTTPGGESIGFYASLRLRFSGASKIKGPKVKVGKKDIERIIGVQTTVEVHKSSIWKPFRSAPLIILFDYGIDDIRANLQFIKDYGKSSVYTVEGRSLSNSMEEAISIVEQDELESVLKDEVIALWMKIERKFNTSRKHKER